MGRALNVVILAAGQGTRMRSAIPKPLHRLGGKPLLAHVIDGAAGLEPDRIVVVCGHGAEPVRAAFSGRRSTGSNSTSNWVRDTR